MKNLLKHWQFWVAVLIILLGVFIFSFAIYYTVTDRAKLKNYTQMTAVVVDYEERRTFSDNRTKITYAEVVEYSVNGVTYKAANNVSSTSPKKLGESIKIAIKPDDPSDCVFVNSQKWTYVFLYIFGAAIIIFGSLLMDYLVKNL